MLTKYLVALLGCFALTTGLYGNAAKKKSKYHCEKTLDGKIHDLPDIATRKECKKKGGKWKKAHAKNHKGHTKDDGHDHHD